MTRYAIPIERTIVDTYYVDLPTTIHDISHHDIREHLYYLIDHLMASPETTETLEDEVRFDAIQRIDS